MMNNKFSKSILLISITIFLYVFYKSEFFWGGELRSQYLLYYFVSFFLIILSIITFFINEEIKTTLIISLITILIFLFSYEAYLTLKKSNVLAQKKDTYKKNTGKKFDERPKHLVYYDLKDKKKNITVSRKPSSFIYSDDIVLMPLSGKSYSSELDCNENGYFSIYESDRYGFNNPDSEWDNSDIEFLIIGDSFAQGACVNRPNDISSQLRLLSKKSVLNLGMSGNGPMLEYASLKEYYRPNTKHILWFFYEANDLTDISGEINNKILRNYLDNENFSQNLKLKQKDIDKIFLNNIPKKQYPNFSDSKLFSFLKMTKLRYKVKVFLINIKLKKKRINNKEPLNVFKKILHKTKSFSEKNNSKLYFVYLPRYHRYKVKNYNLKEYKLIKDILIEMNIPIIDLHKNVFEKEDNPLNLFPFAMNGHYTVEGYNKIAKNIFKTVNGTLD